MADVLVTCRRYDGALTHYPQIRGHYLAKHLAAAGVDAEFRELPLAGYRCEVVISSEYQAEMDWFERYVVGALTAVDAERWFCITDYTLGDRDHFSRESLEWFAARGGVLCMSEEAPPAPFEHVIGVGVDADVVPGPASRPRNALVDFPVDARLPADYLAAVRERLPGVRLVGAGPAESGLRDRFDTWVPYGQSHPDFVAAALDDVFACIPGQAESLGLTLAEAQVAGAAIVHAPYDVKASMLCPVADFPYRLDDPVSLAAALAGAFAADGRRIAAHARARFDFSEVVRRTRSAVGV